MATLANLSVSLTAKTAAFTKGFKKARRTANRFLKGFAKAGLKAGAVFGAAIVAGTTILIKRSLASIDATAKLSDRIGIATEKLQGLRHAAEITGAGTATMDKALMKMQKTLGEAAKGLGLGRDGLKALNLNINDLIGKKPDEQFIMITKAVNKLKTAEEKAFVATSLFGRAGQSLINTMDLGADGLEAMQKEAEALGVAFNRIDAAKVEAANDALFKAGQMISGIGQTLAIQLAPFIEAAANKFTALGVAGDGAAKGIADGFEGVLTVFAKISDGMNFLKSMYHGLATVFKSLSAVIVRALITVVEPFVSIAKWIPGISQKAIHLGAVLDNMKTNVLEDVQDSVDKTIESYGKFERGSAQKAVSKTFGEIRADAQKRAEAVATKVQAKQGKQEVKDSAVVAAVKELTTVTKNGRHYTVLG